MSRIRISGIVRRQGRTDFGYREEDGTHGIFSTTNPLRGCRGEVPVEQGALIDRLLGRDKIPYPGDSGVARHYPRRQGHGDSGAAFRERSGPECRHPARAPRGRPEDDDTVSNGYPAFLRQGSPEGEHGGDVRDETIRFDGLTG